MMYHTQSRMTHVFYSRLSEWFTAATMLVVGYILFTNSDLMATVAKRSDAYKFMLSFAEQKTWAVICIYGGIARLIVLGINGAWRKSPHLRGIASFLFCFVWYHITVSFYEVYGLAFGMAFMILLLEFFNLIRCFGDARVADVVYGVKGTK